MTRQFSDLPRALSAVVYVLFLAAAAMPLHGQATATSVKDSSMLKPPQGYKVAIIEWEDMECPACAHAFPILKAASAKYHVPWIQYDYPLGPVHPWSRDAAIYARWFDTHSRELGDQYREKTFAAQNFIHPGNLREFTSNFAKDHGLQLPFVVDPQGRLAAQVNADHALGEKVGLEHTPTIFIVTDGKSAPAYTEILNADDIYSQLDKTIAATGGVMDKKPAAKTAVHHTAKRAS